MAIKAIMLRKRIELKKAELAQHRERAKEFVTRKSDITEAIGEATTEEEIDALNEGMDQLETEWKEHEETENRLSGEIAALEQQRFDHAAASLRHLADLAHGLSDHFGQLARAILNSGQDVFGKQLCHPFPGTLSCIAEGKVHAE